MKTYGNKISFSRNSRGVYILDTSIGCGSGMAEQPGGCYGDCYAAKSAKLYGYDFTKTVLRNFISEKHKRDTVIQLSKIKMPFIRIGGSGDPSENWEHCINILKVISRCNKEIIIITRHWTLLTDEQLKYLSTVNICINTSVSALDTIQVRRRSIEQYERIKPFCKSVLRIVSCDFNTGNPIGKYLSNVQSELFLNDGLLDTVFRPSVSNHWVTSGIVNAKKEVFNGKPVLASKMNKKTYMGKCGVCKEMCGVNISTSHIYNNKRPLVKQLKLPL